MGATPSIGPFAGIEWATAPAMPLQKPIAAMTHKLQCCQGHANATNRLERRQADRACPIHRQRRRTH